MSIVIGCSDSWQRCIKLPDLPSSGLEYTAPNNLEVSIVFFGFVRIVMRIKVIELWEFSQPPTFTLERLVGKDLLKCMPFYSKVPKNNHGHQGYIAVEAAAPLQQTEQHADDTYGCFLQYCSISSATLTGTSSIHPLLSQQSPQKASTYMREHLDGSHCPRTRAD